MWARNVTILFKFVVLALCVTFFSYITKGYYDEQNKIYQTSLLDNLEPAVEKKNTQNSENLGKESILKKEENMSEKLDIYFNQEEPSVKQEETSVKQEENSVEQEENSVEQEENSVEQEETSGEQENTSGGPKEEKTHNKKEEKSSENPKKKKTSMKKEQTSSSKSSFGQKDLHPKDLTLVDITNFNITINYDICNVEKIAMLTLVSSAVPNHKPERDLIRETWGRTDIEGVNTRLVFILGRPGSVEEQEELEQEAMEHQDIVQGGFMDTYENLSYKTVFGLLWASRFCEQAEFVVKTDDDWMLDLYGTYTLTRQYRSLPDTPADTFLACGVRAGWSIHRDPDSKWYVSNEMLSDEENGGTFIYPPFCTGSFSITTPGTAGRLAEKASSEKFLWLEDVWVSGYLARALGIQHIDIMEFWAAEHSTLISAKNQQGTNKFQTDYLVGPSNNNLQTSAKFTENAERCYREKCKNNIYHPRQ